MFYILQIIVGVHDSRSIFQLKKRVPIDDTYTRMMNVKKYADVVRFRTSIRAKEARWPGGRASDSGARGRGFDPHSGRRVVSLSKIHLPPKKYW